MYQVLDFQLLLALNLQNFLRKSFKNYVENTYFEPKNKKPFFQILR